MYLRMTKTLNVNILIACECEVEIYTTFSLPGTMREYDKHMIGGNVHINITSLR